MTVTISAALLRTGELAADLGAWVAMSLDRRILEVDEDTEAYGRGHIPGALAVHWKHDLQDPVRRDFIGPEAFAALMDRLGIDNDTQVVLYGGNSNWFAAYAYWYFRYYGHRAVRLLDGGRRTWELEGRPLTTEVPEVASGMGYRVGGPVEEIRALRGQVQEAIGNGEGAALVDVRSPAEFSGELMVPPHLEVVVRNDQGGVIAEGHKLRRGAPGPMSLLVREGDTIRLEDHWPTQDDLGLLVLLPGGEAGILTSCGAPGRTGR